MQENTATQYITISVAEYHCLTKAAAMLEVVCNIQSEYDYAAVVNAAKAAAAAMQPHAEAGAEE